MPSSFPVDLSIILVNSGDIEYDSEQLIVKNVINALKKSEKVARVVTSAVDFILVDSQTTAILSSDRLYSEKLYNENIFKIGELRIL